MWSLEENVIRIIPIRSGKEIFAGRVEIPKTSLVALKRIDDMVVIR